jgi:hypothetical protein
MSNNPNKKIDIDYSENFISYWATSSSSVGIHSPSTEETFYTIQCISCDKIFKTKDSRDNTCSPLCSIKLEFRRSELPPELFEDGKEIVKNVDDIINEEGDE